MAFVKVDQDNGDPRFSSRLISCIGQLDSLYAILNELSDEMAEMTAAQIETFYGVAGFGAAVRTQITDAFAAFNASAAIVNLRTKIG